MPKMNLSSVELTGGIKLEIIHNLPMDGLNSFPSAVHNWIARTKLYTAQSLCDYINSKHDMTGHIAFPKSECDKSMKRGKKK
jgi:hypothetical protein